MTKENEREMEILCVEKFVEKFVGHGGKYNGYKVIFDGDISGIYHEREYVNFVTSYCFEKG